MDDVTTKSNVAGRLSPTSSHVQHGTALVAIGGMMAIMKTLDERIQSHLDCLLADGILPRDLRSCGIRVIEITPETPEFDPLTPEDHSRNAQIMSHYKNLFDQGKRQEASTCLLWVKDDCPLYVIIKDELQEVAKYEARFEQLQGMGYFDMFVRLFGVYERFFIFGVEVGDQVPAELMLEGHQTIVNVAGPSRRVIQNNWDANSRLRIV
jgi:hypothetical protein